MTRSVDLLLRNGIVVTMDPEDTILPRADVAVDSGRIVALGPHLPVDTKEIIDVSGQVIMPGLVNSHTHETLLRGLCEDLSLMDWLSQVCYPVEQVYRPEHSVPSALMNQLEMIKGGVTTFIDIYRYCNIAAETAERSGLRAIFCPQIIETPAGAGETLASNEAFVQEWRDRVPGRIQAWFGPHAPYSTSADLYRAIARKAERYGVGIHTHLCETAAEVALIGDREGMTPVAWLDSLGMLSERVVAAHCIHLTDDDIDLLARRNVGVAYNPGSNMKLASGVARVVELQSAGIRLGLGTDSNLSNNNLDMFEEMRIGATLQKVWRQDATALRANQVLRMATMGGAQALGLANEIGSIEVGKKADLITVDLHQPHLWPVLVGPISNVVEQLVYSAGAADVSTTIVDGRVLMHDRRVLTLDESEAEAAVNAAAMDLVRAAEPRLPKQWVARAIAG